MLMTADLIVPKSLLLTAFHLMEAVLPASEVFCYAEQVSVA